MYKFYHDVTSSQVQCKARPRLDLKFGLALVQMSIGGVAVLAVMRCMPCLHNLQAVAEKQLFHKLQYLCRLVCKFTSKSHGLPMPIYVKSPAASCCPHVFVSHVTKGGSHDDLQSHAVWYSKPGGLQIKVVVAGCGWILMKTHAEATALW